MLRILGFSLFCTAFAAVTLNAGQIQIGGAAGLTAAYVGAQAASIGERAYSQTLFVGDTINGATPVFPSAGPLVDSKNNVTFSILSDPRMNYWGIASTNDATATMTVPVGISGITNVWTMLNDVSGFPGIQNTSVTLNFGNTANAAVAGMTQTFNFVNGTDIRDATNCTGAAAGGSSSFPTPCSTYALTAPGATQIFSTAYNGNAVAGTQGFNTSGNLVLDDQSLLVNPIYFGKYLVNIQITNANGGSGVSRAALSAITVATPEPASIAMFLGGFAAMMLFYSRRRSASGGSRS